MKILEKMKSLFEFSAKTGLYLPMAYDAATEKPSVTLLAFHLSITVTILSLVALHFYPSILNASLTSIGFSCICFVFYRLRNLDKVKFNLEEKSFELEDTPEEPKDQDEAK